MDALPPGTLTVWLKVTPEEAIRRAREEGPTRPLLAVPDPVKRARELLRDRERFYEKADLALDSQEGTPEELAREIETIMTSTGRENAPSASA
jgi:shikimate kinase